MIAFEGSAECVSIRCRRQEDWQASPLEMTKGGCRGYHCAACSQPSGMYGHMYGDPPEFHCPEIEVEALA